MATHDIISEKYAAATKGIMHKWLEHHSPLWYNYIVHLREDLKVTYLVVLMHNQVFNGGFHQYFTNAYGQFAKETIDALIRINALYKANLLSQALDLVKKDHTSDEAFRSDLLNFKIAALFDEDDLLEPLDVLDDKYYAANNEDITELLTKFLSKIK